MARKAAPVSPRLEKAVKLQINNPNLSSEQALLAAEYPLPDAKNVSLQRKLLRKVASKGGKVPKFIEGDNKSTLSGLTAATTISSIWRAGLRLGQHP